jgi:hypothetical protein
VTEPADSRSIALILDTTAILAYAAGSMHVHEPVLLASEAGQDVGLPVHCLIEAVRHDPAVDLRELLHLDHVITVMPDRHTDADLLADWTIYLDGREDAAAAAVLTYRHQAGLLTGEPDLYAIADARPEWIIPSTVIGSGSCHQSLRRVAPSLGRTDDWPARPP